MRRETPHAKFTPAKFIFSHFTTPPIYAILSRYEITPMPGYLVTPAGSLVFGEMNNIKEETP
ncbi:hypothetical protein DXB04_02965 [Enterocloster bolteae]|nr:hypothetical protein DXB04_02965 [Enterocloster bolteae]